MNEFVASNAPTALLARGARLHRLSVRALRGALSFVLVSAVFYLLQRGTPMAAWLGVGSVVLALFLVAAVVTWLLSRRVNVLVRRVPIGRAFSLDAAGVRWGDGTTVAWPAVRSIAIGGRHPLAGPDLIVTAEDGRRLAVGLDTIDALPGTIDSAIRAFSGGRRRLDLSGLDRLI